MRSPWRIEMGGTSVGWSIRNSCSRMNTSPLRIGFSEPASPLVCACLILSVPLLLKLVSDSAVLRFNKLPASPNPTRSSLGIDGSSPANSMVPNSVRHQAGPVSTLGLKRSSSVSPERTPAGDMIVSSEPLPILATLFPTRR